MKRLLTILAAILLTVLCGNVYAQKNKIENDYLSERDFRGSRKYLTASGDISEGAVICLKEVKVGEFSLKNKEVSVVKNQKAPLLLGQSVLERFGTITIDNMNNKLIIKNK